MAIPTYIGSYAATLVEEIPTPDFKGTDRLVQVWECRQADAGDFLAARKFGQSTIQTINDGFTGSMYFQSGSVQSGGGPFSRVTLNYEGFLYSRQGTQYADLQDEIVAASNSVSTDAGESVQISYYTQQTTYRWFSTTLPRTPRFPQSLPSNLDISLIYGYNPSNFNGDLQIKYVARCSSFVRVEVATNTWAVVETWVRRIEDNQRRSIAV